jgi:hypothetical protein
MRESDKRLGIPICRDLEKWVLPDGPLHHPGVTEGPETTGRGRCSGGGCNAPGGFPAEKRPNQTNRSTIFGSWRPDLYRTGQFQPAGLT